MGRIAQHTNIHILNGSLKRIQNQAEHSVGCRINRRHCAILNLLSKIDETMNVGGSWTPGRSSLE